MNKTILVVDNGNSLNNGVMAMALVLNKYIKSNYPNYKFIVHTFGPNYYLERKRWSNKNIDITGNNFTNKIFSKDKLTILILFLLPLLYFLPKKIKVFIFNEFFTCDIYISLGGEDLLSDNCSRKTLTQQFLKIMLAVVFNKKIIVLAQSFGPFEKRTNKFLFRFLLKKVDLITTRGKLSKDLILDKFNKDVELTGDLAFLLQNSQIENNHFNNIDSYLGVSVSELFILEVIKYNQTWTRELFYKQMAKVLDETAEKYDLKIVFFPHVTLPNNNDRDASKKLQSYLRSDSYILENDYPADEIKYLISKTTIFIGCRMHALVAALSNSIPTIALAYSPKVLEVVLDRLGYKFVIDLRVIEPNNFYVDIQRMLGHIFGDKNNIKNDLNQKLSILNEKVVKNFERLEKCLKQNSKT